MFTLKIKQRSFFVIIALTVAFVIGQVAFSATSQGSWSPTPTKSWSKPAATPTKNWNSWQPTPTKSWSKPVATPTKNWNSWQPTPTKSWNNKPTPTPIVNNGKPEILSFEAKVVRSYPNGDDEIEMKWETKNVAGLEIRIVISWVVAPVELIAYQQLGVRMGSTKFMHKPDGPSVINVELHIVGSNDKDLATPRIVSNLVLNCQYPYFFDVSQYSRPSGCPLEPTVSEKAVYQKFEHGFMLWFEKRKTIDVYSETEFVYQPGDDYLHTEDASKIAHFNDTWNSSDPVSDPTLIPPSGKYQPQYGFGKLWRDPKRPYIRNALGWAVGPEISYTWKKQHIYTYVSVVSHLFSIPDDVINYYHHARHGPVSWVYYK